MNDRQVQEHVMNTLDQPLYDGVTVPAAAATVVKFFDDTANKTKQDTNLTQPHRLPGSNEFVIDSISIWFPPEITNADSRLLDDGYITILINDLPRFEDKVFRCPGGSSQSLFSDTAAAALLSVSNGIPSIHNVRRLRKPIAIYPNQTFSVNVHYFAGITLGAATKIFCFLDGPYTRSAG